MSDTALSIRTFRDGDEQSLAVIFNHHVSAFVGPASVTPESWRQQYGEAWRGPLLGEDRECFRVAERGGQLVGYAICECPCRMMPELAMIQELSVAEVEGSDEIAGALVADAEARARAAGVPVIVLHTSDEDGLTCRVADALRYERPEETTGVFMAAITDLAGFLTEMAPELSRRLAASPYLDWQGVVHLRTAEMGARLQVEAGHVKVTVGQELASCPIPTFEIAPDLLPPLLFGRISVREAYLQNGLSVEAADKTAALELLDALFPRLPIYLPRSQWW